MSTAVIKAIQIAGSVVEVLAVADDGTSYRVQTDGTLTSLKAVLQQASKKANDLKTKPEIAVGQSVDFTPIDVVPVDPAPPDPARAQFFADRNAELTQLELAKLSPDLQSRYKLEYGSLR